MLGGPTYIETGYDANNLHLFRERGEIYSEFRIGTYAIVTPDKSAF
jgi:hypothetical protein